VPRWVPAAGALVCAILVVVRTSTGDWRAPALAGGLLLGIVAIYAVMRPNAVEPEGDAVLTEPSVSR
jgi:basic amino acid/polyamine antiporter, APA family